MCPARFNLAEDGYESIYTADFLSHFLFTTLLLPSFTSNARIINVSSIMHYWVGHEYLSVEDLDSSKFLAEKGVKEGDVMAAHADMLYSKAKLSQVVWGRVLGEKLTESEKYREKGIFVASCHPGLVTSTIWYRNGGISPDMDKMQARVQGIIKRLGVSTEQGACTPVFLAVDPSAPRTGGVYWDRQQACTPNALVFDEKLGEKLWAAWMRACRLSEI
ncbi:NAD(P)-binding protein [Pseudohyphozyma bogoriensis]|nr:NAD(P)-binding protein [Pseudohyphozyma bogoriensis]